MRVQTEAIHFSADVKLLSVIESKISKLEHFFDRILEARVILKLENSGQIKDKIAEVKIHLPNGVIFIKETSKTFEAALDKALVSLKRQLVKYKDKMTNRRYAERSRREEDTI
jgi:putative sigma-54 modulation protein